MPKRKKQTDMTGSKGLLRCNMSAFCKLMNVVRQEMPEKSLEILRKTGLLPLIKPCYLDKLDENGTFKNSKNLETP